MQNIADLLMKTARLIAGGLITVTKADSFTCHVCLKIRNYRIAKNGIFKKKALKRKEMQGNSAEIPKSVRSPSSTAVKSGCMIGE